MKALWQIYYKDRNKEIQHIGLVIASTTDFNWLKKSSYICCDIIEYL